MGRFLIGALAGLIVGGLLTFFLFVGVPRADHTPGEPIKPPDAGTATTSARVVLTQDLLNGVLGAIFKDMQPPSFQFRAATNGEPSQHAAFQQPTTGGCGDSITILPEGSGVRTGVKFENGRVNAPLAFSGSWASPVGCYQFTGWAQANLELRYERSQQKLFGTVNVATVNLDGVNPVLSGFITPVVQSTLNNRVNPIEILNGKQLVLNVPIASTAGTLHGEVTDMRADFKEQAVELSVVYDLKGSR